MLYRPVGGQHTLRPVTNRCELDILHSRPGSVNRMPFAQFNRRAFITFIGVSMVAWPLAAQQFERMRRIGVMMLYPENAPAGQARAGAFRERLAELGWAVGRNLRLDFYWGVGDPDWARSTAAQLLSLSPDVILANTTLALEPLQQATRTIPIIFIGPSDPVAQGFVQSLAHPGGNITGFVVLEPSLGGKFLGLLKEIAPHLKRVAVLVNPEASGNRVFVDSAINAAPVLAVDLVVTPIREPAEIEPAITRLQREPDCGLLIPPDTQMNTDRKIIIELLSPACDPGLSRGDRGRWSDFLWGRSLFRSCSERLRSMPIAYSEATSRVIFPFNSRQSSSSPSTSRRRSRSDWKCRRRCSPPPTR